MTWRLLLVDDETAIRTTLAEILSQRGFVVQTASSAENARQILAAAVFDLVITDLHMETEISGYEVVNLASRQVPRPGIIVVSGYPDLACNWKQRGAHAFLQKPTLMTELLNTVDHLLAQRSAEGAA